MALSDQELDELKERCNFAHTHGFKIALAEQIAADLEDEGGEVALQAGMVANSPAHLLALVAQVEQTRSKASAPKRILNKGKKATPKEAAAPKMEPKLTPTEPAPPEPEPAAEEKEPVTPE